MLLNVVNFGHAERFEYHIKSHHLNPDIAYNPPERVLFKKLKNKFHKNSYATDLWAFGVLFLELITNGTLKECLYGY